MHVRCKNSEVKRSKKRIQSLERKKGSAVEEILQIVLTFWLAIRTIANQSISSHC